MRITVVGTGYVGLVAGAGFADFGNDVVCLDTDEKKIAKLREGEIPIYEPGLADVVQRNVAQGRLAFDSDYATAVAEFEPEVVFLAVGTPQGEDGSADLQYVLAAAKSVGEALTQQDTSGYTVIVDKSTVPVGTAAKVREVIRQAGVADARFAVVSNPEFLKEGTALLDFTKPDRVVLGVRDCDWQAREILIDLYQPIVLDESRILTMDVPSAELTKYAANTMLATRISFMNELAHLAEKVGADIDDIRRGIGTDCRIGDKFLHVSPGFGGSCFGKDLRALISTAFQNDTPLGIAQAAYQANERQRQTLFRKIKSHFKGELQGKKIAVWGLAFKPKTDDVRDSPAIDLVEELLRADATVQVFDPEAMNTFVEAMHARGWGKVEDLKLDDGNDMYEVTLQADALVLVTEWHVFRHPDFGKIASNMNKPIVFDGRNIWDPTHLRALGFTYYGIGRV